METVPDAQGDSAIILQSLIPKIELQQWMTQKTFPQLYENREWRSKSFLRINNLYSPLLEELLIFCK